MDRSSKINFSLFGHPEWGYRRFLYNGYLPFDHPDQGVYFWLTAEKLKHLNEKSNRFVFQMEETLKSAIHDRVWPVDRRLIILTSHCLLNAMERVNSLLAIYPPGRVRFITPFHLHFCRPSDTAAAYMDRFVPEIYERILIFLLNHHGVEISLKSSLSSPARRKKEPLPPHSLSLKRKLSALGIKYRSWKEQLFFKWEHRQRNGKPLLLVLNGFLDSRDIGACNKDAVILKMNHWLRCSESSLTHKLAKVIKPSGTSVKRWQWEKALSAIPLDGEDSILKEVIPFLAKIYPVSLIEGRNYLRANAYNLLREINGPATDCTDMVLSIDHRLWKYESLSALSNELIQKKGRVVASSHDKVTGLLNYGMVLTLDQCLVSHYLGNFKKPFVPVEDETPEVIQIDSLKNFQPVIKEKKSHSLLSIWYFPHYLVLEPNFNYWLYGMENPESFLELQKAALMGLHRIAEHPKVKEIALKLKYDPDREGEKQKYVGLIEQLLGKDQSPKIRFVTNLTMKQALPQVSIAVHDLFTGAFVETMSMGLPTLAILSPEVDVSYRLPDREYWIKSGTFVRNEEELYESLLGWVEGKVPDDYERMRNHFMSTCGSGSPAPGEGLLSILKKGDTAHARENIF